jgi:pteridine reductase
MQNKTALITGSAKRVGAVLARTLHAEGMNIAIHYHASSKEAIALCDELNQVRSNSAISVQANLLETSHLPNLINAVETAFGRLDFLVNNASSFYPTPIGEITEKNWEELFGSNLKAPLFLAQAAVPLLKKNQGCIVNIVDIHGQQPLKSYTVYCLAKAGLWMLTKSLAKELGPEIRVNGIAPGAVLWPDNKNELSEKVSEQIISRTALKRPGTPEDIAQTLVFLIKSNYITGQIIAVDGGRTLNF